MNNLLTSTKKLGTSCVEKVIKMNRIRKVNNTKSTKFKSCAQHRKASVPTLKEISNYKKTSAEPTYTYTQVIQPNEITATTNTNGSHISTVPSITSSVINIYKIEEIKRPLLIKLLKGASTTKIRLCLN